MAALVTSHVNMSHCQKQKSVSVLNRGGQFGLQTAYIDFRFGCGAILADY